MFLKRPCLSNFGCDKVEYVAYPGFKTFFELEKKTTVYRTANFTHVSDAAKSIDLILLKFETPIKLEDKTEVSSVCLPKADIENTVKENALVAGVAFIKGYYPTPTPNLHIGLIQILSKKDRLYQQKQNQINVVQPISFKDTPPRPGCIVINSFISIMFLLLNQLIHREDLAVPWSNMLTTGLY